MNALSWLVVFVAALGLCAYLEQRTRAKSEDQGYASEGKWR